VFVAKIILAIASIILTTNTALHTSCIKQQIVEARAMVSFKMK
jgi:hypothetical protein